MLEVIGVWVMGRMDLVEVVVARRLFVLRSRIPYTGGPRHQRGIRGCGHPCIAGEGADHVAVAAPEVCGW